jgi:AAA+ superfamily predicted ATPase
VGESESRLNLALNLIEALSPVILMIDEIDQQFQSRSSASNDGGVSQHYLKTLFKFAARDDLRGKICIVACSNTPQLLDPAMIDRFGVTLPLLEPTPEDIARIFPMIEKRITKKEANIKSDDANVITASEMLSSNSVSPRQLYDIISRTIFKYGENFSSQNLLEVCKTFRGNADTASCKFSSLSAINLTLCSDYLPWAKNPQTFRYPDYLKDVVDTNTGRIREVLLRQKLNEFGIQAKF